MSTMPHPDDPTVWQRWTAFWFSPQDPITLGFIRVIAGLLVLYTHLAYCLDFQAFFGKRAWWGQEYADRERKEIPFVVGEFWDWNESGTGPRLPDVPHRRQAVMEFVRIAGTKPPREREHDLRLLNRIANKDLGIFSTQLLNYLNQLGTLDRTWDASLHYLMHDKWPAVATNEVEPLHIYPPVGWTSPETPKDGADGRLAVADEIRSFHELLPKDADQRKYVLNHLFESNMGQRQALYTFLTTLPEDPGERDRIIGFLEYWNSDPRLVYRQGEGVFSVWFHMTHPTEMAIMHGAILVVMFLFTIGYCTRVTSVLTWMASLCYIHRTVHVLFGQDTMMNILLLYLMIGNSGAALSVDRLIARYRAVRAALRRSGSIDPATRAFLNAAPPTVGSGLGVRLIQVHFCFIYCASGLAKLQGAAWWNGTAFWDVMVNPEFTLMRFSWYESMIRNWAAFKWLYNVVITIGVWFTLALEISFAFLIWTRMRVVLLWAGVLLHASIGVIMGLNLFELLMMVMLLSYFPSGVIRSRLKGSPDLPKFDYSFDPANAPKSAALLSALDVENQAALEPKPALKQPTLTTGGLPISGSEPVTVLFGNLRLLKAFRWLLWVPGMKGLLGRLLFPAK